MVKRRRGDDKALVDATRAVLHALDEYIAERENPAFDGSMRSILWNTLLERREDLRKVAGAS